MSNGQWQIIGVKVLRHDNYFSSLPFPEVHFVIHVKRKPLFYVTNIILLSLLLAVLVVTMCKLPPESGEKISMGVALLLSFSMFILMINNYIPETSAVPLIVAYIILFMSLTALAIMESVLVLYCFHHTEVAPPPEWVRFLVFNIMCKCLCNNKTIEPNESNADQGNNSDHKYKDEKEKSNDWSPYNNQSLFSIEEDQFKDFNHSEYDSGIVIDGKDKVNFKNEHTYCNYCHNNVNTTGAQSKVVNNENNGSDEWKLIGHVIDRFCFRLFVILFILLKSVMLIILPIVQPNKSVNDYNIPEHK